MTIGYKSHFFPIGHHICSKHMTAFQSLLFILNARYSSFHMFFKPPSLIAAYNLKISDQAILGRTSTWTYTTIHTTTTYGSTDTRRCGFYFSLEMLQNSTKKTLFGLSIGAHHGVSNRTIFEPPSGTDDAGHWRSAGRIRMYVNVVFYYYPPPATMAHTLHPLTPLFLSSTLLTVYMEMRLSLQKLLFADIPFVRSFVVGCCSMMNQRGGDDDMTQISESSPTFPLKLYTY